MKENFLTMNNLNMNPKNITTKDESIDDNSVVLNINQIRMHSMQNFKTRARMLVKKKK